ncbi:MAG: DUF4031 domain-containing protein [Acidimicrobiales bacterium]|nr:DUF4031 domain-containing protein [Acidimicrobiales bacterium]
MAILVDEAIWEWRGRRWAHLVSDSDPDELHDFAHRLGVPYLAFQGDHYDIHTELRRQAIGAGARPVSGREVVVALRDAGLRRRGPMDPWQWRWRRRVTSPRHDPLPEAVDDTVGAVIRRFATGSAPVEVARAQRSAESVLVVSTSAQVAIEAGLVSVDRTTTLHRSRGERGTYAEWRSVV